MKQGKECVVTDLEVSLSSDLRERLLPPLLEKWLDFRSTRGGSNENNSEEKGAVVSKKSAEEGKESCSWLLLTLGVGVVSCERADSMEPRARGGPEDRWRMRARGLFRRASYTRGLCAMESIMLGVSAAVEMVRGLFFINMYRRPWPGVFPLLLLS
jgi:hypothetical protein